MVNKPGGKQGGGPWLTSRNEGDRVKTTKSTFQHTIWMTKVCLIWITFPSIEAWGVWWINLLRNSFWPIFFLIASVPQLEPVFFQSGFPPPCWTDAKKFYSTSPAGKKNTEFSVANWEGLSIPNWALCCFCWGFDYGLDQITTIEYVLALFPGIEQANPENGTCLRCFSVV